VTVIAVVLIALALIDWLATVVLIRAAHRYHEAALTERAIVSVILTLIATGTAVLAADYLVREVTLPAAAGTALLTAGLLAVSLPQIVWAILYWRGRFR